MQHLPTALLHTGYILHKAETHFFINNEPYELENQWAQHYGTKTIVSRFLWGSLLALLHLTTVCWLLSVATPWFIKTADPLLYPFHSIGQRQDNIQYIWLSLRRSGLSLTANKSDAANFKFIRMRDECLCCDGRVGDDMGLIILFVVFLKRTADVINVYLSWHSLLRE